MKLGENSRLLRCINDFLPNRQIYVHTYHNDSAKHKLHRAVPEGNVLCPFLFNPVITGLPYLLPSNIKQTLCADDICLSACGSHVAEINDYLQAGVVTIASHLLKRGICLSQIKSALLPFARGCCLADIQVRIQGNPCNVTSPHMLVAVILERKRTW